jgi:hypothetical protein
MTGHPRGSVAHRVSAAARIVLPAASLLAGFTAAMLMTSGADIGATTLSGLVCGGMVIAVSGYLVVAGMVRQAASHIALTILLGTIATGLFLTAACLLTAQNASAAFLAWTGVVAAVAAVRLMAPAAPPADRVESGDHWAREGVAVAAIAAAVAVVCRRSAGLLPTLEATGLVPVWNDYFIHATEIAQFGVPLAAGRASFLLVDQPIVFYHYASYMLPAAAAAVVDLPALGLATSLLLPYGVLLMALGVYALVRTAVGDTVAALTAVALLAIPDASTYGLRNGFFGFHWLLFTNPGSGYGLGVAFAALAVLRTHRSTGQMKTFWLGLMAMAAVFEFRAQIFILLAPALVATLLWESEFAGSRRRAIALSAAAGAATIVGVIASVPAAREAFLHFSVVGPFVESIHTVNWPTAYDGAFQRIQQGYGRHAAVAAGFLALVPAALGALAIIMPALLTMAIRRTGWRPLDSFPLWCIAAWLALVAVGPQTSTGMVGEYQHRPFMLVYAAAFVWTVLFVNRVVQDRPTSGRVPSRTGAVPSLLAAAAATSLWLGWRTDPARPLFDWGARSYGLRLDAGLLDAARFVRARATAGDTFALIPADRASQLDDAATRFAALSDVPAYVARAGIQMLNGESRRAVVEQRLAELQHIENSTNRGEALQQLRSMGVTFVIVLGDAGPRFDPGASQADFKTSGAAVYRVR